MNRVFAIVGFCAVAGVLASCTPPGADEEMTAAARAAATFCAERGGTIETVNIAEGRTNLCALPDGSKPEALQYMTDSVAAGAGSEQPVAVAKAATTFCEAKGGTIETVSAAEGRTDLCILPDGSRPEASQYMSENAAK